MGKALLILVLGFTVVASLTLSAGPTRQAAVSDRQTARLGAEMLAREIALTGFSLGQQKALGGAPPTGTTTYTGTHQQGTYTITVVTTGSPATAVKVTSVGRHGFAALDGAASGEAVHTVEATFALGGSGGGGSTVPAFMKYVILSDGDMNFNGSSNVWPEGYPFKPVGNANLHSNSSLTLNGGSDVRGYGTFGRPLGDQGLLSRTGQYFRPPFNTDGQVFDAARDGAAYRYTGRVDIPTFNAAAFKAIADEKYLSGNVEYKKETIVGGTRTDPKIIYIENELQFKNNVQISGYVIFVVRGNINMNGGFDNLTTTFESNVAFYTEGTLNVNGSANLVGQILCNNLNFNGSGNIYGTIATRGHVNFNGSRNIYYRPAAPTLAEPIFGGEPEGMTLAAYREWSSAQ